MLTDSGGFQVMSLNDNVKIDDDGVTFTSIYDGSKKRFTPEDAVVTQEQLGADIQMALDVCPPLPSPQKTIVEAMNPQLMVGLSAAPGLADVADEATALLQAAIAALDGENSPS